MLFHLTSLTRRTILLALTCIFLTSLSLTIPWWHSQAEIAPVTKKVRPPDAMPGQLLVRFRSEPQARFRDGNTWQLPNTITLQMERFAGSDLVPGLRLVRVNPQHLALALDWLQTQPEVLYAEPDYIRRAFRTPNDAQFGQQWGLHNTGQPFANGQPGMPGADIKAPAAWDLTTGSRNVVAGIIDEGVDLNHPDLAANIWTNPGETPGNGLDDDGNGYADDIHGWDFYHEDASVYDGGPGNTLDTHGTHVAGIAGAHGDNGNGITGVNWQVSLLPLKILGEVDAPAPSSVSVTVRAYNYAKQMRDLWLSSGGTRGANLRILNNSYGGNGFSQAELDAIRALAASDILFVCAAGNEGRNNNVIQVYPANYQAPNVISVAASDRRDNRPLYTNFGNAFVHLAAPGDEILSAKPNGTYGLLSGTSMAAPHVAGTAALMLAAQPDLSLAKLRGALLYSGDPWVNYQSSVASGRRLNAFRALQTLTDGDTTPPAAPSNLVRLGTNGRQVALAFTEPGDDGANGTAAGYEIRYADTNLSTPAAFAQAFPLGAPAPGLGGAEHNVTVTLPWRHASGFIGLRAFDSSGNAGPVSVISVGLTQAVGDPYIINAGTAQALSTGGTPLNLRADDQFLSYNLPFGIPFFGPANLNNTLYVSTNGVLYFNIPPSLADDARSSTGLLNGYQAIAGLWDDLRTDRRPGDDVYVVQPDDERVIFRWQGVTYDSLLDPGGTRRGENPVNFEIELQRDGTIITRYGAGNQRVLPVVGISGGGPEAYVATTHTSEFALRELTDAPAVIFTPRAVPPLPNTDLYLTNASTELAYIGSGQYAAYQVTARSNGPGSSRRTKITFTLPPDTTFVSCQTSTGACNASGNTVTADIGTLNSIGLLSEATVTVHAQVNAAPGIDLTGTMTISSTQINDTNPNNNTTTTRHRVLTNRIFDGVSSLAAGNYSSHVIKNDGTVWSWGDGALIGDGYYGITRYYPVQTTGGLAGVTALSASSSHVLALRSDGTVWTWGRVWIPPASQGDSAVPIQVNGLENITALAAGTEFSLAVRADGTLWAWGANNYGQLGRGSDNFTASAVPVQVSGVSGMVTVAAGARHSVAVRNDGTVWTWGFNERRQLGYVTSDNRNSVPAQVSGVSSIQAVAASDSHTLALGTNGAVWQWGLEDYGLADDSGSLTGSMPPAIVPGLNGVTRLAAGRGHNLALRNDGTVWAWGRNWGGQLGLGGYDNQWRPAPAPVPGLAGVTNLSAGRTHSLASLNDGAVRAWGGNGAGQLGDGGTFKRGFTQAVGGLRYTGTPILTAASFSGPAPVRIIVSSDSPEARLYHDDFNLDPTEASAPVPNGGQLAVYALLSSSLKVRAYAPDHLPSLVAQRQVNANPWNRIDQHFFFAAQHYRDFLNREPDQAGLLYWAGQLRQCLWNYSCYHQRRIEVSAAFFIELEFQDTGGFIYRLYQSGLGRRPAYAEFSADRAQVIGGSNLEQNKQAFALAWVQRAAFVERYPLSQDAAQFVDALLATILQASNVNLSSLRPTLIAEYQAQPNQTASRARVARLAADAPALQQAEYNKAFVLMQYFGYLRREVDQAGYDFWLDVITNREPGNFRGMVCAFLTATEYQLRFDSVAARSNQECGP